MRKAGVIKWYGNYNSRTGKVNRFGFIGREGASDLYVHENEVECGIEMLREGTSVTFEVGERNGLRTAKALRLLKDETDSEVIRVCATSSNQTLWQPVLGRYLEALPLAEAVRFVESKIRELTPRQQVTVIQGLDPKLLIGSPILRTVLPIRERVNLYLDILSSTEDKEIQHSVGQELVDALTGQGNVKELWEKVPAYLYENDSELRAKLPTSIAVRYLVERIVSEDLVEGGLVDELAERLVREQHTPIWNIVPDTVLRNAHLRSMAPRNRQVAALSNQLEESQSNTNVIPIRIATVA